MSEPTKEQATPGAATASATATGAAPSTDRAPAMAAGSPAGEVDRIRQVYRERDSRTRYGSAMGEAARRLADERFERTLGLVRRLFGERRVRVLDLGCGTGGDLVRWRGAGWPEAALAGTDVSEDRVAAARAALPGVEIRLSEGDRIPFDDASFDMATAATVFSSILDPQMRRAVFSEMERVVRPGGAILVYDFVVAKPTNPNVIGMPVSKLTELGRRPDHSWRLSPFIYLVAAGARLGPRFADLAWRIGPPTHRLSYWRVAGVPAAGDGAGAAPAPEHGSEA